MIIAINDYIKIASIQDHFTECFPGLHIEFYANHHDFKSNKHLPPLTALETMRYKHINDQIEITSLQSAEKIMTKFKQIFGLLIKIYRFKNGSYVQLKPSEKLQFY